MSDTVPGISWFDRIQRRALVVGGLTMAACAVGAWFSPSAFFQSYLVAFIFWGGLALGCFAIVMLQHLVGGSWGAVIRRLLESATRTFPFVLLLLIPLLLGLGHLYSWARPEVVAGDELLKHKRPYLNHAFFYVRAAFYFACWMGLSYLLNKWSAEQDRADSVSVRSRLQKLSAPGLLVYGLTVSFASVDWVMSLEPHWYSTIFGIIFMVGQALTAISFAILALWLLSGQKPLSDVLRPQHFHDLGNLMLAFVMLWAYMAFSQYLIIWAGNVPEETPWYLARLHGGWGTVAAGLIVFHFAVPFLVLLSRRNKRRMHVLAAVAGAMLVMRLVDLLWTVIPAFHPARVTIHWMNLAAPVAVGGLWLAVFIHQLKSRPLLPLAEEALLRSGGK